MQKETLANALKWKHLCDVFERCRTTRGKRDKLSVIFNASLRRIVLTKQSPFPLVRLVIPQLDGERKNYNIHMKKLAAIYVECLGVNKKGVYAERLRNYRDPEKLRALGLINTSLAGDFPRVVEAVLAEKLAGNHDSETTLGEINEKLDQLVAATSAKQKQTVVMWMLQTMSPKEHKWFIRVILKDMKIGLKHDSVLTFLGQNAKEHFGVCSDLRKVVESLHDRTAGQYKIKLGTPFSPMLAKRYKHFTLLRAMGATAHVGVEQKMDGERMLIHKDGGSVRFYTRNRNDYTKKYGKAIASYVRRHVTMKSCILDGEMMSWDDTAKAYVKFGHNRTVANEHVRDEGDGDEDSSPRKHRRWLCFLAFDIVHNGKESITHWPLRERRALLDKAISPCTNHVEIVPIRVVGDGSKEERHKELMHIFADVLEKEHEGIILKDMDSPYLIGEGSRKEARWVKLKPDYIDSLSETLDLVVLGAYYSKSRARGGTLNHFLMGLPERRATKRRRRVVDEDDALSTTIFHPVCKVGSGLSDDIAEALQVRFHGRTHTYDANCPPSHLGEWTPKGDTVPDVWFRPDESMVIEIRGTEIVPTDDFGVQWTLRFPRIVRLRPDKCWWHATSVEQFRELIVRRNGGVVTGVSRVRQLKIEDVRGSRVTRSKTGGTIASRKSGRGVKRVVGVLEDYRQTDVSDVAVQRDVFRGAEIVIFPPHHRDRIAKEHHKAALDRMTKAHNGHVVMNVTPRTVYVVAYSKRHVKVSNFIQSSDRDVYSYRWLLRCVETGNVVTPYHSEFIHQTSTTSLKMRELVDEYGDSLAEDTTFEQLVRVTRSMPSTSLLSATALNHLENVELRDVLDACSYRMFARCVFYVLSSERGAHASRDHAELLRHRIRLFGGCVVDTIDRTTTHVVINETEAQMSAEEISHVSVRLRERFAAEAFDANGDTVVPRRTHVVTAQWVLDCTNRAEFVDPRSRPGVYTRVLHDSGGVYAH